MIPVRARMKTLSPVKGRLPWLKSVEAVVCVLVPVLVWPNSLVVWSPSPG